MIAALLMGVAGGILGYLALDRFKRRAFIKGYTKGILITGQSTARVLQNIKEDLENVDSIDVEQVIKQAILKDLEYIRSSNE